MLTKTIYLFGEVHAVTSVDETSSNNLENIEPTTAGKILRKISKLRNIVDEKHVRRIFVEAGGTSEKLITFIFREVGVEVLQADPIIKRIINVAYREIADSIAMKEDLLSDFANIPEEPINPKKGSHEEQAQYERYAHVLQERMKALTPADGLFHKLDEATADLEAGWVDQIHKRFVDPSLLFCGKGHIYPSKEDILAVGKSGRIPDLLQEKGYNVEVVFVESDVY
nr:hypothetical protein [Candidatus Njordarchaeota archaeon]